MNSEIPVLNADGTVVETRECVLDQLYEEAARGTLRVKLYRGPEAYGAEAFYTLLDGTVLHEVNGAAADGSGYRTISLVVEEAEPDALRRLLTRASERWSPIARA